MGFQEKGALKDVEGFYLVGYVHHWDAGVYGVYDRFHGRREALRGAEVGEQSYHLSRIMVKSFVS